MAKLYASTICYYGRDEKILFIKFNKKYSNIYCTPGGKVEQGETPTEGIIREYFEETGLMLINPRLRGLSFWQQGENSGIIYVYAAHEAMGNIIESQEGKLEWHDRNEIKELKQFGMNRLLTDYVLDSNNTIFEGKFMLDDDAEVIKYNMRMI